MCGGSRKGKREYNRLEMERGKERERERLLLVKFASKTKTRFQNWCDVSSVMLHGLRSLLIGDATLFPLCSTSLWLPSSWFQCQRIGTFHETRCHKKKCIETET